MFEQRKLENEWQNKTHHFSIEGEYRINELKSRLKLCDEKITVIKPKREQQTYLFVQEDGMRVFDLICQLQKSWPFRFELDKLAVIDHLHLFPPLMPCPREAIALE